MVSEWYSSAVEVDALGIAAIDDGMMEGASDKVHLTVLHR
jgi:hypothetical protein